MASEEAAASEPIQPVRTPDPIEVCRAFAEPMGAAKTIARYIGRIATRLYVALEENGLNARRLDLVCHSLDSRAQAIRVSIAVPLRDAKRMTRLPCDKIETIDPGFSIHVVTLAATRAKPMELRQVDSGLIEAPELDVSGLMDLLSKRVGERTSTASPRSPATCPNGRWAA